MSDDSPEPDYFSYNDYTKVRNKLNKCNYNYEEKKRFANILSRITNKNAVNWNDKIFACLHSYLTHNNGYMPFSVKDYCRYINFWLNGEVRESGNEKFQPHFNSFKDFAHNYAYVQQNHYDDSCEKYIHKIEDGEYSRMKFLYEFYDLYDNLRSQYYWVNEEACKKLPDKTINYNQAIESYYDQYPNLYKNISYVKDLIEKLLEKTDSKCKKSENFRIPPKYLEYERKRKEEEAERKRQRDAEAERQRQRDAEAERQRQRDAEAERERQRIQQDLVSHRVMQQMHTTHDAQRGSFQRGESLGPLELENSGDTLHSETQESRLQQYKDQSEQIFHTPRTEHTNPDGSFLGSSGFPGYITEVFRSVEPAPILGVSGGMGALFLLFKYTPIGSFFGGRRGRFRQIPRTFNGPFPGGFPNFQDYDGGFVGYAPMNISPLGE
ncbi:VIR protein [Plasmodium vivax]|uniref:VIR protein n=1 Tax=Plasmodium vivax TaxID=5855 RepID=A0A1G4E386_PLAVI|nr:VIR protein [Plasmodium vivax]